MAGGGLARRAFDLARTHRAALVVVLLALALRGFTIAVYSPSVLQWFDAPRFARTGEWAGFFSDYSDAGRVPSLPFGAAFGQRRVELHDRGATPCSALAPDSC